VHATSVEPGLAARLVPWPPPHVACAGEKVPRAVRHVLRRFAVEGAEPGWRADAVTFRWIQRG